jgi:hypothetical protein
MARLNGARYDIHSPPEPPDGAPSVVEVLAAALGATLPAVAETKSANVDRGNVQEPESSRQGEEK